MTSFHRLAIMITAALSIGVPGAVRAAAPPAGPPVEINAILSTTGVGSFIGTAEAKALAVLEAEVNAGGGIHGRPLHFNVLDDTSNPQVTVQLVNQLTAQKVPLFLGPMTPPACLATAGLIDKTGPVSICLNPFGHPPPGSYQFNPFPDSYEVAAATVRYARLHNWTRIAMINATDGTGHDSDNSFAAAFRLPENRDVTLVDEEHYAAGDVSVSAQIARIKAANPQAIVSFNTGTPFGTVLRGLHDAGLDLPVLTGGGNMTIGQMKSYEQFLPTEMLFGGQISFAPGDIAPGPIHDDQTAFVADLKRAGLKFDGGYAIVWDPAMLAVEIIRHVGTDATPAAAREYFANLHGWTGTDGVFDFKSYPQRGVGANSVLVMRWNKTSQSFEPASRRGGLLR